MKGIIEMRVKLTTLSLVAIIIASFVPRAARAQREPMRGWVGVAYTTGIGQSDRNGALVFNGYPVIESIEPNSPAEKAGLEAGDTILAMNSQDLRRSPLPVSAMIQPGQKILFRFKRNDTVREVMLTVAPRPRGTSETLSLTVIEQSAAEAAAAAREGRAPTPPAQMGSPVRARVPMPPGAAIAPLAFGFGPRSLGVAGAELTGLNADLGFYVGVTSPGIFVVNVALGTPAKESGLRPGDVIIKADASPVGNPGELIRVMRESNGSSIRLDIVRKRKPQTITLRW
jgi:serine protease Do